ncbi:hypothetical protein NP233_g8685 [Leucocoprinus birnbaumii]|uniref:Uncharacterized protein n=1 Tax=Leucocoprinus birnbaumii TaxID=56174 RepID=A0AAD5VSC8_9AGAR|nr:hypothetical protein NP233_g8685 [Leucocoprinus birnbaumii]
MPRALSSCTPLASLLPISDSFTSIFAVFIFSKMMSNQLNLIAPAFINTPLSHVINTGNPIEKKIKFTAVDENSTATRSPPIIHSILLLSNSISYTTMPSMQATPTTLMLQLVSMNLQKLSHPGSFPGQSITCNVIGLTPFANACPPQEVNPILVALHVMSPDSVIDCEAVTSVFGRVIEITLIEQVMVVVGLMDPLSTPTLGPMNNGHISNHTSSQGANPPVLSNPASQTSASGSAAMISAFVNGGTKPSSGDIDMGVNNGGANASSA